MKIIKFPECNVVFAEHQEEYLQMPALKLHGNEGSVICCWKLTLKERVKLLFTGSVWHYILTFNQPLQPQLLSVDIPHQVSEHQP